MEEDGDAGFVKNFVARLNASSDKSTTSSTSSVRVSSSCARMTHASAGRTSSVQRERNGYSSFQQSFRSREVGDTALPTVIKGQRGADGASMPLRPSAAQHVQDVDTTTGVVPRYSAGLTGVKEVHGSTTQATAGSVSGAASARAFWEAKSSHTTPLTKKAGSQLESFSKASAPCRSLREESTSNTSSVAPFLTLTKETMVQASSMAKRESQKMPPASITSRAGHGTASNVTATSNNGRAVIAGRSRVLSTPDRNPELSAHVAAGTTPERSPELSNRAAAAKVATEAENTSESVFDDPSDKVSRSPVAERSANISPEQAANAKPEAHTAAKPTPVADSEDNAENGDAEDDEDSDEVEDSSDGETAGGYSFGAVDSDSDEEADKKSDDGSINSNGADDAKDSDAANDKDEDGNVDKAPARPSVDKASTPAEVPVSAVKSSTSDKGTWYKYTSGFEFAAPPIRRRRNVEGEMEADEEEDQRARYIGFNDTVTVFEDDLAGSQHHYTFMFNW